MAAGRAGGDTSPGGGGCCMGVSPVGGGDAVHRLGGVVVLTPPSPRCVCVPPPQPPSGSAPIRPSTPRRASGRRCWVPAAADPPSPSPRASPPPTLRGKLGWGGKKTGGGGGPGVSPECHHRDVPPLHPPPRTFNDESPLGIRRILSQSTDSLNMRNRTLSVESLIDEGGDAAALGGHGALGGDTRGAQGHPSPPAQAPTSSSTS